MALLAGLAYGGWAWWTARQAVGQAAAASAYQTAAVRRGDLTLSISGSGTVTSGQSLAVSFGVSGTLVELNVQVGDSVQAGQVLASLANLSALELAVQQQELAVEQAQHSLAEQQAGGELVVAQAQANLAGAQVSLVSAQANLLQPNQGRCSAEKNKQLYFAYLDAQKAAQVWENEFENPASGYGRDYILEKLAPLRLAREQAKENLDWCYTYTDQEVQQSQADLQLAQAQVASYSQTTAEVQAAQGIDSQELAIAQAALSSAQAGLAKAQADLAAATLEAPISGTVMAINAALGDALNSSQALLTIADLAHPQVQVNIDETDLTNFAVGCDATISFDSLPGQTFTGLVSSMSPSLVTVQSVGMVQGLIDLQNTVSRSGKVLLPGMAASVEVTCQQAKDALLVPLQAVVEPDAGAAYVYVLNSAGQPEKRTVEVGLKTVASAAITSGLEEGEKVLISRGDNP
jgi:RND family efflux transporter MFP subunit